MKKIFQKFNEKRIEYYNIIDKLDLQSQSEQDWKERLYGIINKAIDREMKEAIMREF